MELALSDMKEVEKESDNWCFKINPMKSLSQLMFSCYSVIIVVSRKILMPVLVAHLHQQLAQKQEMRACAEILGSILTSLQKETSVSSTFDESSVNVRCRVGVGSA